jgi:predicted ferric reductase
MKFSLIGLTSLLIYLSIVLIPLGIVIKLSLPVRPFLDQLSSSLAILGFNIILLEFLISGRIRSLSKLLGVDWILQAHQLIARTAAVFLVAHPLLYTLPTTPSFTNLAPSASHLGLDATSALSGFLALAALVVLIGLAITRHGSEIKYEQWRLSHAVMSVLIVLLGFHHTTHAGRFSQETAMLRYWQVSLGIALLSLAWVYIARPFIQKLNAYEVSSVKEVAHRIFELSIHSKRNRHFKYEAGQFAWLKLNNSLPLFENPFSISSAPGNCQDQQTIQFLIKDVGDFTSQIKNLKPGALAYLDAPYGNFGKSSLDSHQNKIVMIVGGVGIAPIISLLRSIEATNNLALLEKEIHIIYGNRIQEQMLDLEKMINLTSFKNLRITPIISEPNNQWTGISGVLDVITLEKVLHSYGSGKLNIKQTRFYVCGPAEMIDSVERALETMGAPFSHIESEKFQYDFTQKNARNRLSIILMGLASSGLVLSALYLSRS